MKQLLITKKVQIGCVFFILLAVFASCHKDKTLIETTWMVENAKKHADSAWMDGNWEYPTLSFIGKDRYVFQSDNFCFVGRVKIEKRNNIITFERTTASIPEYPKFSSSCFLMLTNNINSYKIEDEKLILAGNNGERIILIEKGF